MDFLQSTWFMWVVIIIIAGTVIGIIAESFGGLFDGVEGRGVVLMLLKGLLYVVMYIFLPVVILYGLISEGRSKKRVDKL